MKWFLAIFLLIAVLPLDLSASTSRKKPSETWKKFTDRTDEQYSDAEYIAFAIILKFVGTGAVVFAICLLFMGKFKYVGTCFLGGFFVLLTPTFIETVFTCTLPR